VKQSAVASETLVAPSKVVTGLEQPLNHPRPCKNRGAALLQRPRSTVGEGFGPLPRYCNRLALLQNAQARTRSFFVAATMVLADNRRQNKGRPVG